MARADSGVRRCRTSPPQGPQQVNQSGREDRQVGATISPDPVKARLDAAAERIANDRNVKREPVLITWAGAERSSSAGLRAHDHFRQDFLETLGKKGDGRRCCTLERISAPIAGDEGGGASPDRLRRLHAPDILPRLSRPALAARRHRRRRTGSTSPSPRPMPRASSSACSMPTAARPGAGICRPAAAMSGMGCLPISASARFTGCGRTGPSHRTRAIGSIRQSCCSTPMPGDWAEPSPGTRPIAAAGIRAGAIPRRRC